MLIDKTFRFKHFTIRQAHAAMKVGTDGVLLGVLASGGSDILDIGTGTGVIALMMAQRFPAARVTAIDIDAAAAAEATANATASPFADRVHVLHTSAANYQPTQRHDAIVCNPPYFEETLQSPDAARRTARHAAALPYSELCCHVNRLLQPDGTATIILPTQAIARFEQECAYANLFITDRIDISTTPAKPPKRTIITIRRTPHPCQRQQQTLTAGGERTQWYNDITKDFYL